MKKKRSWWIFVWLQEATDLHGIGQPLDQGGPMFQCMYCGATFPHQSKLTRHILSHSLDSLKFRESTHYLHFPHDIPPPQHFGQRSVPPIDSIEPPDGATPMDIEFAAAAAAAAAASGNSLNSGDPNSVVCKFCGKSFPDVASLIQHLPVHTGDRPFKCEFCGKAFKLRHHMKDHCRVHTGEWFWYKVSQQDILIRVMRIIALKRVLNGQISALTINIFFFFQL